MQIWMQDVYCNLMNDTVRDTADLSDFEPTDYGADEEASIPLDVIQTDNNVVVSSCPFQLSEEEITTLNEIDVFAHGGNTGISIYLQVVNLLRTFESIERNTKMYSKTKSRFFLCLVKIKQKHHAGHFFFP